MAMDNGVKTGGLQAGKLGSCRGHISRVIRGLISLPLWKNILKLTILILCNMQTTEFSLKSIHAITSSLQRSSSKARPTGRVFTLSSSFTYSTYHLVCSRMRCEYAPYRITSVSIKV